MTSLTDVTHRTAKEVVRTVLDDLPDDATWDEIQDAIDLQHVIARGLQEVAEGKLLSEDQLKARLAQWLD